MEWHEVKFKLVVPRNLHYKSGVCIGMKQVRTQGGEVFGPYNSVELMDDRYNCNSGGIHLPFSVVGNDCVIEEYVQPPEPEPSPEVSQ